ncbi:MAG: ferrochelatase [Gemmatimonadales bacterium]
MVPPIGVLVMAYGGPNALAEVEPYLLDVRGFRPTPSEIVEEVKSWYAAIGGCSPILVRTEAQARALEAALSRNGRRFPVVVGMRHWQPRIRDALARLADAGIQRAVGLVMAPHYSRLSIDLYFTQVEETRAPVEVAPIREWHLLPGYLAAVVDRVRAALERFPAAAREEVPVIFTAHSLPRRILEWQDPYPAQLAATVEAVLDRLGPRPHRFAYQSAAMTHDPWLGPDAGDALNDLAAAGHQHALIAPIGFTCEHVEVLYDVDIGLRRRAEALGVHLERMAMVNDHPEMIAGLADLVRATAEGRGWL